ncbi:hypothetical protein [Microbispora bryophytorum]|uniref:Uncharacterized protein n=1 Tax=Microbispora bryophytorum TaxID=1460882 RepID=A0A8H9LHQ4_9ACTN|nr:hypothetical protein [Microbispora bryophytorum]GGO32224.1 hypothetical protein GCM10011574_71220 [Microbispora bryophytorum]
MDRLVAGQLDLTLTVCVPGLAGDADRLGEVAAIETTPAAAAQKLEAMRELAVRSATVHLGSPTSAPRPADRAARDRPADRNHGTFRVAECLFSI